MTRLYSENDLRRVLWIRHLTQNMGVNLAGVRILFELGRTASVRTLVFQVPVLGQMSAAPPSPATAENPVSKRHRFLPLLASMLLIVPRVLML